MKNLKEKSGITLIALVITIIILLILAGVTISALSGDNGILSNTAKAKEETEIASLIEEVELARLSMIAENNGDTTKRASELMYYLVDDGVLKEDRLTFKSNEKYSLYTNGNIMRDGEKVANVKMTENIEEREGIIIDSSTNGVFYGVGYMYDSYLSGDYIIALEVPEGYQFAYWINENNDIVSYNEKYFEHASTRLCTQHLYAVYTKETIENKPAVSISLSPRVSANGVTQSITCNIIYHSNEYKLKEFGLIRTYESSYKNKLTLDNVDGNNIRKNDASSEVSGYLNSIWYQIVNMSQTTSLKPIYARAYAVYTDSTGKDQTIYSNVAYSAPLN